MMKKHNPASFGDFLESYSNTLKYHMMSKEDECYSDPGDVRYSLYFQTIDMWEELFCQLQENIILRAFQEYDEKA
jgi:hypothetical protein